MTKEPRSVHCEAKQMQNFSSKCARQLRLTACVGQHARDEGEQPPVRQAHDAGEQPKRERAQCAAIPADQRGVQALRPAP
eukprot:403502-Prymnesium_polylepis.1